MVINSNVSSSVACNGVDDSQDPVSDHSKPSVRICRVDRRRAGSESGTNSAAAGTCGFHLTRTKWDPYPWIAGVDDDSPAQQAGLKVGDCVLEVNGEDLLGLRVGEIASKVQNGYDTIAMLLWNSGSDTNCDSEVGESRFLIVSIRSEAWRY